jgi:RimJ/RimL family protein N-acetyltransferase
MLDVTPVFATFPTLETKRFILRAITPEDALEIFRLYTTPEVTRYLPHLRMTSLDEAVEKVQRYQSAFEKQESFAWAVIQRGQSQLMGTCVLHHLNLAHHRAEVGYSLSPEWWGKGVMSEVVAVELAFAFETMGFHSLEAIIDPDNTASRRLLEKLGFVQEAHFREDWFDEAAGRFTDTAIFSLLKSNWRKRSAGEQNAQG